MGDRYLRPVTARCGDCAGEWTFENPDLGLYRDWVKAHLQGCGKPEDEAARIANMLWDRMRLQLLFDEVQVETWREVGPPPRRSYSSGPPQTGWQSCTCETDGACQVCRSEHWRFTSGTS